MIDAVEADACRKSFYQFIKSFWNIICTDAFVENWHIRYLADELQKGAEYVFNKSEVPYKLLVNVSPGTSKSSIILYLFPVWVWTNDDTQRFTTSSHSASLSIKGGVKSRDILLSPKFKRLFPKIKLRRDLSAKTFYQLENGGNRTITSKSGNITGLSHNSFILVDDISDASKANSESDKLQTINHIQTISTREARAGYCFHVYLQQRLSEDDATAYLLKTIEPQNIRHVCLPAILSDDVKPFEARKYYNDGLFDAIRLNKNVLDKKRKELGSHAFSAQYMQNPISAGGNLVKSDWFTTVTREYSIASVHTYNTFIDTGYKQQEKGKDPDPSGWITCYFENNTLYISDYQEVWESIMNLCRYLDKDLSKLHSRNSFLYVEPRASGVSIVQVLRELSNLNVCEIKGRKESKLVELTAVLPLLESGRVVLVEGAWNDLFIKRLTEFPYGKHDEAVDVLCYALNHYIKNDTSKQEAKMKANIRKML